MQVNQKEICRLVEAVWTSLLGLEVQVSNQALFSSNKQTFLTGGISVTGAWRGMVRLDCPAELACQAAAHMFGVSPEDITAEQVQDALREITNIIGGNLKALLPSVSFIGLPTIADGNHIDPAVADPSKMVQAYFQCQNFPFRVTLLEQE